MAYHNYYLMATVAECDQQALLACAESRPYPGGDLLTKEDRQILGDGTVQITFGSSDAGGYAFEQLEKAGVPFYGHVTDEGGDDGEVVMWFASDGEDLRMVPVGRNGGAGSYGEPWVHPIIWVYSDGEVDMDMLEQAREYYRIVDRAKSRVTERAATDRLEEYATGLAAY